MGGKIDPFPVRGGRGGAGHLDPWEWDSDTVALREWAEILRAREDAAVEAVREIVPPHPVRGGRGRRST